MAWSPILRKPSRESRLKTLMDAARLAAARAAAAGPPKPEHA